jgi:hypothetical protein
VLAREQLQKMAMSTVEEKLQKFQFVCEDKLRKIELLKHTHEKNKKILESYAGNYEQQTEIAQLSLTIAEIKYKTGKKGAKFCYSGNLWVNTSFVSQPKREKNHSGNWNAKNFSETDSE